MKLQRNSKETNCHGKDLGLIRCLLGNNSKLSDASSYRNYFLISQLFPNLRLETDRKGHKATEFTGVSLVPHSGLVTCTSSSVRVLCPVG